MKRIAALAASVTLMLVASSAHADSSNPDTTTTDHADSFRVGALVGAGFPRPLSVGAFTTVDRTFGFGLEYGFLPKANLFGAEVGLQAVTADFRFHPFKNAFFVGLAGGRQWLNIDLSASQAGFSGSHSLSSSTWFIAPRIGALHTFASGVTIGIDAGVQIPIANDTSIDSKGVAVNDTDGPAAMRTAANTFGGKVTPTIDLLRVGFAF